MSHDENHFNRRTLLAASAAGAAGWLATTGVPPAAGARAAEPASAAVTWSRQVPIRYEADVAVIGGGIAGVSAACAAAQSGARVVLVERFAITGGDLTVGGVANFCGDTKGQGEVFDAIVADLDKFHAVAPYQAAYPEQKTRVFGHKPDDDKRTYILPGNQLNVPPYQIPLRSLIVRDGVNLLAAGRCFSAGQLALSSARVSTTCSMLGQAAGVTAALAAAKDCDLRRIDPADVRRILVERGARLEL